MTVEIHNKHLNLPKELASFMGYPKMLLVYTNADQLWLRAFAPKHVVKIVRRLLTSSTLILSARGDEPGNGDMVVYSNLLTHGEGQSTKRFRIVNYDTKILLFQSEDGNLAQDRENFWKTISGYHEHLEVNAQNSAVVERTKWFVNKVNAYAPSSVLELGCGSGRNLYYLKEINPQCNLYGVEVNPRAVAVAKDQLGTNFKLLSNSMYALDDIDDNSIDVVFTSGVLMHIPKNEIQGIKKHITRIAKKAIIHYELHGPAHDFDFHRYPRNYENIYDEFNDAEYNVFNRGDMRNAGVESFHHALLNIDLQKPDNL